MRFDLFCLMQQPNSSWRGADVYRDTVEHVRLAEQMGFETAWFAEHHFSNYSLCASPLMAVAYMAGRTERIGLGTGTVVAPMYEPMRLVQEIGMADQMSEGRLVLGIGSGYQGYEFERFRLRLDEAVERTLETLDIIELALTEEQFEYAGKHYQIPLTQIAARTFERRVPPIWVAGLINHEQVQRRLARSGYVPMVAGAWRPLSTFAPARANLDEIYASFGRDPAEMPLGVMRFVHVTDSKDEALEAAACARYSSRVSLAFRHGYATMSGIFVDDIESKDEPPLEEMVENYIIGDVEHCIEKIVEDWDVMRHSHLLCNVQIGGVPRERVLRTLEALGQDILPGVEKELARRGAVQPKISQSLAAAAL